MKRINLIAFLPVAALLVFACSKEEALTPDSPKDNELILLVKRGLGKPEVFTDYVDVSFDGPPGIFCADLAVRAHTVGKVVIQIWTNGNEALFKEHINVYSTFTNLATGASITLHQTNTGESLIRDGQLVGWKDSGGSRTTIPGKGLVVQYLGHSVITIDYSGDEPVITVEFMSGRYFGDICDFID